MGVRGSKTSDPRRTRDRGLFQQGEGAIRPDQSYPSPTSGIADLPEQTRRWLAGDSIEPEDIAQKGRSWDHGGYYKRVSEAGLGNIRHDLP